MLSQTASRPIAIVPGGPHRATMAMMRSAAMPHDRGNPRVLAHQHAARAEIEAEAAALAAAAMASARRAGVAPRIADGMSGADAAADLGEAKAKLVARKLAHFDMNEFHKYDADHSGSIARWEFFAMWRTSLYVKKSAPADGEPARVWDAQAQRTRRAR